MDKENFLDANSSDYDLQLEKFKLKETINIINEEILRGITKRKGLVNEILNYRKKFIEDYKDDEDQVIEYFDHERYVQEEAFKTIDRKLKELNTLKYSPYFGRIIFEDKEFEDVEKYYIGRFGVTPEGYDEPLIIDWRAPVASLFYAGTLGEHYYSAPGGEIEVDLQGRRQYIIKKGELQGCFDSDIDVKDEILQMVLSSNSNEKLKDIVMTIQKEQDEIIRNERLSVTVVNGVAGSGKTTIALHRIAYLLYNYRKQLEDKTLILGPNSIFMEYIGNVLPSLGEGNGVKQSTFREFAMQFIEDNKEIVPFTYEIEQVLKGEEEFLKEIKYKGSESFLGDLDKLIEDLNENYFKVGSLLFNNEVLVDKEEILSMINKDFKAMPLFRRSAKVKRILYNKIRYKRDDIFRDIESKYKKIKEEMPKDKLAVEENNINFKRKIEIRNLLREVLNAKESLRYLDGEKVEDIYNRFNNNKILLNDDLGAILYLKINLQGLKVKEELKHVVIDEAQDYSMLQFIVIKKLTGCNSFTIVGDVNQRLIKKEVESPMMNLHKIFPKESIKMFSLNKSYRSTKEIMDYANKFITGDNIVPLVRSGDKVYEEEVNSIEELAVSIKNTIDDMEEEGLESLAIICRNKDQINKIAPVLKETMNIKVLDNEDIIYRGGNVLIPSYFAKGLEFDGVIMVDEDGENSEDLVKYVMCTRALHRLYNYKINFS
ncbi:UvrD-helicase domain-containing protein [Clostridium sp.]|uniref:HelD family protein n=1 Tax=Clostridium sp. TaxID=1506 RepID=UPI0034642455